MTGPEYVDHPLRVVARIELAAVAHTWKCRHCASTTEAVPCNGTPGVAVELSHEPGCPDHDDQLPAVEYGDE